MAVVYWLIAAAVHPPGAGFYVVPGSCDLELGRLCCRLAYIVDRFCCPTASTPHCSDDCSHAERAADEANALWGAERHCWRRGRWRAAGGFEYYSRPLTLWGLLVPWSRPVPLDERGECLRFNPNPEVCSK